MRRPASVLGVQIAGTAQRSGKTVRGWGIAGSEMIFPDAGFDQNTVRHLGNVDGKRDLTASEEAGFAKIWVRMRDWERKRCSEYRLQRYGTRDSRE